MVYDVVDGQAMGETHYNSAGTATMYMMYIHDENGAVNGIGLWYPGNTEWTYYYFVKNLQGDVLEVYNEDHGCVASYTYDSWGNVLTKSGSLADINPFRYRSYYFDNESWFYYLQSRYYDPAIGRFINADILTSTGQGILGNNMFAYCCNCPVNYSDPSGYYLANALNDEWIYNPGATRKVAQNSTEYCGTVSLGISASATLGPFTYGAQIAVVTDSLGYSEIQFTYYSPISSAAVTGTPSVDQMLKQVGEIDKASDVLEFSVMGNVSFYNAPLAENLHGLGYQVGGSVGTGSAIAVDYNIVPNGTATPYRGITISGGWGSTDLHASMGATGRVMRCPVSVYDLCNTINWAVRGGY